MAGKKSVWDLVLQVGGKDAGASQTLRTIKKQLNDVKAATKQCGDAWKDFGKNVGKLALGATAGITAIGAGVLTMSNSFAEAGDKAAKTSAALGIGIEAYQELQYAMGQSGVSAEELDGALQKFNLTVKQGAAGGDAAAKKLASIGLSAQKLNSMAPEQAIKRISDYMQTLPDDAARTRVAVELFGKQAGPKMMAALKMGSNGLDAFAKEARKMGIIITDEQAHMSESYGDNLDRLKKSVTGLKNQFIAGAIGPLSEAFKTLADSVSSNLPNIQELGAKFGEWLGQAVQKLPAIIQGIKDFFTWIGGAVGKVKDFVGGWKNLAIVVGSLLALKTAILGIVAVVKTIIMIKKAWVAIQTVLNVVLNANPIGLIITAIAALVAGVVLLIKNWDKVKEKVKAVWDWIAAKIKAVVDFIKGIFEGIKNFFGNIFGGIKNIASKAWNGIKESASVQWGRIKDIAGGVFNKIKEGNMAVAQKMREGWNKMKDGTIENFNKVKNFASGVFDRLKEGNIAVVQKMSEGWGRMKETASAQFSKIKEFAGGLFERMKQGNADVAQKMIAAFGRIKEFFLNIFESIKAAFEKVVNFFKGGVEKIKGFFSGIGEKVGNFFSGGKKEKTPGHAAGGIFTNRHIAEVAEKGAEAIIPLNRSSQGFDLWKRAGELGGYIQKAASSGTSTGTPSASSAGIGSSSIEIQFTQNNTFTGAVDNGTIEQIGEAGRKAADDLEARLNEIMRNRRRVSYA